MLKYLNNPLDWDDAGLVSVSDEVSLWSAAFGMMMLDHLRLRPGIKVLDVGCGTGFPLLELSQRLGPSASVFGIDQWQRGLERAELKIETLGLRNIRLVEGDAAAMDFTGDTFDLIVSNLGINNFKSPEKVFKECFRVSKPGGCLALTSNPVGHMAEFYEIFRLVLQEAGMDDCLVRLDEHIRHRLPAAEISSLLVRFGFDISRKIEDAYTMNFADGTAFLNHNFIRCAFMEAWKAIVTARDLDQIFSTLEERLNRRAAEMGDLKLTIPRIFIEGKKPFK